MVGAFVVILIVLLIAGLIWLVWWLDKRRREEWMAQALEMDLSYQKTNANLHQEEAQFKLFQQGRNRMTKNKLSGVMQGVQVIVGDYRYTTGYGKNAHTHVQTICMLCSEKLRLPHCFLRRQVSFFDFLGKLFGGQDINYDEDPEFSKAFVLQGQDETATRSLFNASVREHFLKHKGSSLQFEGLGDTMLFHKGKTIKPAQAREFIEETFALLRVLERAQPIVRS